MEDTLLLPDKEKDVSLAFDANTSSQDNEENAEPLLEKGNNFEHDLFEKQDSCSFDFDVDGSGVENRVAIKRQLSLLHAVSIMVGVIIGSGIFVSPRFVLADSGSVGMALIIWTLCGVIALLGALCYCELGTMLGKSGGEYIYLKTAFGPLPAYVFSWTDVWFMRPVSAAILTLTFANYLAKLFSISSVLVIKIMAAMCLSAVTAINCISVRAAARLQVFFTAIKLLALAILVAIGLGKLSQGQTESFKSPFQGTTNNLGRIGHAFYSGLWAYDGWNQLNLITEELKEPHTTLPRGVVIAVPLVTFCYLTMNIAYLAILSPNEMTHSNAVAVMAASKVGITLKFLMPLIVALSCFGAMNGSSFVTGRTLFSMAREGQMPGCFAMLHKQFRTPFPAILFRSFLALLMLIPSDISMLISWFGFGTWIFYLATFVSLIVLRFKLPSEPRPVKVNICIPLIMTLVSIYFVLVPFLDKPLDSVYGLCVILTGIPVYLVFIKCTNGANFFTKTMSKATVWVQVLCNVAKAARE